MATCDGHDSRMVKQLSEVSNSSLGSMIAWHMPI